LASGAATAGLTRTSEALRTSRRREIETALESAIATDVWACRASACIELLKLPGQCERHPKALQRLAEALEHASAAQRHQLNLQALELLATLTGPSGDLPADSRATAMSLLARLSDSGTLDGLRDALGAAGDEEFGGIVRALAVAGNGGRGVLLDLLRSAPPTDGGRLHAVVSCLVDIEAEELVAETGLHDLVLEPTCRNARRIITALAEKGGPIAARHLIAVLRGGEFGLRSDVVRAASEAEDPLVNVLVVALDDAEEDIRCAAAANLGASKDDEAVHSLLRQLRPFALWDPRLRLRVTVARALGELGSQDAVTRLAEVMGRTNWLRRAECDRLRAAAANALLQIGSRRGLRAVAARETGERCPTIRDAAMVAAARLREAEGQVPQAEEEAAHAV
jgi:hypothetical protein